MGLGLVRKTLGKYPSYTICIIHFTAERGITFQSGFPTKKENAKQPLRQVVHLQRHQIRRPLILHRIHRRSSLLVMINQEKSTQSMAKITKNHIQIKLLVGIEDGVTMWTLLKERYKTTLIALYILFIYSF